MKKEAKGLTSAFPQHCRPTLGNMVLIGRSSSLAVGVWAQLDFSQCLLLGEVGDVVKKAIAGCTFDFVEDPVSNMLEETAAELMLCWNSRHPWPLHELRRVES